MKRFFPLAIALLALAGCQARATKADSIPGSAPSATKVVHAPAPISGYLIADDKAIFVFDPSNMEVYTDGTTNGLIDVNTVQIQWVGVAGPFNGWSSDAWPMELEDTVWTTTRNISDVGKDAVPFKFVVNGNYWVEPPKSATNTADNGMGNGARNYIFSAQ